MGECQTQGPRPFGDEITGFQTQLLVVVSDLTGASGADISRRLGAEFGKRIDAGRFYPTMDALVEEGLVHKGTREGNDRSNAYSLTDEGRARLQAHIVWELQNGPVDVRGEIECL